MGQFFSTDGLLLPSRSDEPRFGMRLRESSAVFATVSVRAGHSLGRGAMSVER